MWCGPGFLFASMLRHRRKPAEATRKRKAREKIFCAEYVKDLNGARAAIAAGYAEKSARVTASKLLTKPNIKDEIARLTKKHADKLDLSAEKVLDELSKLGFSNMLDYMRVDEDGAFVLDFSKLTREQAAAIQEYTVDATGGTGDGERKQVMRTRFKLVNKIDALIALGKHLKLFTEKIEVAGLEQLAELMAAGRKRANEKG